MSHACSIGGRKVDLEWTNESLRKMTIRASKLGEDPRDLFSDLKDPKRSDYAACALLWLLVPDEIHEANRTPEKLWLKVADQEIEGVLGAVIATLGDITVDAEKKSTLMTSHSQGLNLGLPNPNGTLAIQS